LETFFCGAVFLAFSWPCAILAFLSAAPLLDNGAVPNSHFLPRRLNVERRGTNPDRCN